MQYGNFTQKKCTVIFEMFQNVIFDRLIKKLL